MPKVLVLYDSKTGNTRKMARAVAEGARSIKQASVELKRIDQINLGDLQRADGITIGSPKKRDLNLCRKLGQRVSKLVIALHGSERKLA